MAGLADKGKPQGGTVRLAVLVDGKVDEIIDHRIGTARDRDCERLVDVSARPDIVVGTTWPFSTWEEYQKTLKAAGAAGKAV